MEGKVTGPAIGLIVTGILSLLAAVAGLIFGAIQPETDQVAEALAQVPAEYRDQLESFFSMSKGLGAASQMMTAISVGLNAFMAWAGFRMLSLKSWTAAVVASVLMIIPCYTTCCCLIGMPLGIWSLVVLFDKDVKQAFEAKAAA